MAFKKFTRHVGLSLFSVDFLAVFVRINDKAPQDTWCNYARIYDGSLYAIMDDWHCYRYFFCQPAAAADFLVVDPRFSSCHAGAVLVANNVC